MPRNGNGEYDLPAGNPVVPGTVIEASWANNTMNDLAAALTDSLTADGQTTPISNLPMGGYHHTGVSSPTLRNQYATLGMSQDGLNTRVTIASGVDNLVGTLVGQSTAYVAGALVSFFAPANNAGPVTLNYNGIGAKSLVSNLGLPLVAGDLKASGFYMALYNGSAFVLVSATSSGAGTTLLQGSTTGQERPPSGTYAPLTIATATTVNVPAGSAWIVPPGDAGDVTAVQVSWVQQTITLQFVNSSFSTTITVNNTGTIVQFAGRVLGATMRNHAVIGVVEHINGAANNVLAKPTLFGDDGYRGTDNSSLLGNQLIAGGQVSGNPIQLLQLDITQGSIYSPGATPNTADAPNTLTIPAQSNLQFRTLADQGVVGPLIQTAPVANYDPNGAGVVTPLPQNADCTIHRLYYLYGSYIWMYGQFVYASIDAALLRLELDRTKVLISPRLSDAVLVAEIITTKTCVSLNSAATAAIISYGGANFSIGSAGGIGEAPINGTPYGRQDAGWVPVVKGAAPSVTGSLTITGPQPRVTEVLSPVSAGWSGLNVKQGFDWVNIEVTNPDDKAYFRSYSPANGNLRNTTIWDLATGAWTFPGAVSGGTATFANLIKQTSSTDTTAGALMAVGAFGLGNSVRLESIDMNAIPFKSGFYFVAVPTLNAPPARSSQFGHVIMTSIDGAEATQTWVDAAGSSLSFYRATISGVWGAWQQVVTGVKQTSATDATAGALMAVGAFGLGASTSSPYGTDLNGYRTSGFYRVGGAVTNSPVGSDAILLVTNAIDIGTQFVSQYSTGLVWTRSWVNTTFTAWQQVMTSATSLGVGQTWQASLPRNNGVVYTNTTGRPIEVFVTGSGGFLTLQVAGVSIGQTPNAINASALTSGSFIVPNGATYAVQINAGDPITSWSELR